MNLLGIPAPGFVLERVNYGGSIDAWVDVDFGHELAIGREVDRLNVSLSVLDVASGQSFDLGLLE